jgi:hypothetical protein
MTMLGSYPTETREAELLREIKQIADQIDYAAPELKAERRVMILTSIRRILNEWERS